MSLISTELIEESIPDVGPRSVGLVSTQSATLFAPPHELTLANSRRLGPITVAYETYGTPSPAMPMRPATVPRKIWLRAKQAGGTASSAPAKGSTPTSIL